MHIKQGEWEGVSDISYQDFAFIQVIQSFNYDFWVWSKNLLWLVMLVGWENSLINSTPPKKVGRNCQEDPKTIENSGFF